jgi:hypothetical protein
MAGLVLAGSQRKRRENGKPTTRDEPPIPAQGRDDSDGVAGRKDAAQAPIPAG